MREYSSDASEGESQLLRLLPLHITPRFLPSSVRHVSFMGFRLSRVFTDNIFCDTL